jgi:hypothetical protein
MLHTWGQMLDFHPHLHWIVTGGALSPDGKQWRSPKQRKFLFPVRLQPRGRAVELESPSVADPPCGGMCCPLCGKAGIRLAVNVGAAASEQDRIFRCPAAGVRVVVAFAEITSPVRQS